MNSNESKATLNVRVNPASCWSLRKDCIVYIVYMQESSLKESNSFVQLPLGKAPVNSCKSSMRRL